MALEQDEQPLTPYEWHHRIEYSSVNQTSDLQAHRQDAARGRYGCFPGVREKRPITQKKALQSLL